MKARVVFSALAVLVLASAGAFAQAIDPDVLDQTAREPREEIERLPRCPGDPRCAEPDTIVIQEEDTVERMAREPMSPSMEGMGEAGRMPRCPGDPRCQRDGGVTPRQTTARPD